MCISSCRPDSRSSQEPRGSQPRSQCVFTNTATRDARFAREPCPTASQHSPSSTARWLQRVERAVISHDQNILNLRGQPFNMEDILLSHCRTAREIPAANIVNDRCSTQFQCSSHRSTERVSGAIAEHAETSSHSLAFDKVSLSLSCPEVRHWSIGASNYEAY